MTLPRGYADEDLVYSPWPTFTWLRTPLYKQDHKSANQDDLFYCGRTIWPPDEWWQYAHDLLGLDAEYWVVVSKRKGNKCGKCQESANEHMRRKRDDTVGFWEQAKGDRVDMTPTISLNALARLVRDGLI